MLNGNSKMCIRFKNAHLKLLYSQLSRIHLYLIRKVDKKLLACAFKKALLSELGLDRTELIVVCLTYYCITMLLECRCQFYLFSTTKQNQRLTNVLHITNHKEKVIIAKTNHSHWWLLWPKQTILTDKMPNQKISFQPTFKNTRRW